MTFTFLRSTTSGAALFGAIRPSSPATAMDQDGATAPQAGCSGHAWNRQSGTAATKEPPALTQNDELTGLASPEEPAAPVAMAGLSLFDLLLVHRAAERYAKAVEVWHQAHRAAQAHPRELSCADAIEFDFADLPDPGPCPALPEAPLETEPALAARLTHQEVAAELARGRDPHATAARSGASRRWASDPASGPHQLQAALRLAALLGDEADLARLYRSGAAVVIEVGDASLVDPVAVVLKTDFWELARSRARRVLRPLEALRESLRAQDNGDYEEAGLDERLLREVADQAYRKAFAHLSVQGAFPWARDSDTAGGQMATLVATAEGGDKAAGGGGETADLASAGRRAYRSLPVLGPALPPAAPPTGLKPTVIAIRPDEARVADSSDRHRETIAASLQGQAPVLVVAASRRDMPGAYRESALPVLTLPPLSPDLLLRHLQVSHTVTGEIAAAAVRARLPAADRLAGVGLDALTVALREPSAPLVAEALARQVGRVTDRTAAPDLEALPQPEELRGELQDLAAMFRDWRRGEVPWADLDSGILLFGPPGTGKTTIAAALARSMGVPLIEGSYATWQSAGHLGDYQKALRRTFAQATASPDGALILIDEVDAYGTRSTGSGHGADYGRKVLAALLEALDGVTSREGVVVVGTSNLVEVIDPALLRPGRLGRRLHVPAPSTAELPGVLRYHLGADLPELGATPGVPPSPDLLRLVQRASGLTPAETMELVKQARKQARRAGRPLAVADLHAALAESRPALPQALRHRAAIHEAGHAVAHAALGLSRPRALRLTSAGGQAEFAAQPSGQTARDHHRELVALLAGRAAERLVLGAVSSGAGGDETSDLARATRLALAIETTYGLGSDGPVWSGLAGREPGLAFRGDPGLRNRIRARLEAAEREAGDILLRHMGVVDRLARMLLEQELVEGRELYDALTPCRGGASHAEVPRETEAAGPYGQPMPPASLGRRNVGAQDGPESDGSDDLG